MTLPHEDPVDEALMRGGHLDDGGFTERVMGALPPPRRARIRLAPALVLSAALVAAAAGAAVVLGPGAALVAAAGAWLGGSVPLLAVPAAVVGAVAALAATGLLVAYAD